MAAALSVLLNIASWSSPFFWDTILTSSVCRHFLDHGFGNFILPPGLDAGHPPVFYVYVTLFLRIFGQSLLAAHLSMLPFILIGSFSFTRLLQQLSFTAREQWIGLFLFFAIPAVATQNSLVSYDAVLLSLYLLSLVLFLDNKKTDFTIVLILIAGITGRGLFAIAAIYFTCFVFHRSMARKWVSAFIPSVIFYFAWYSYHYLQTGYVFAHNGWSEQRGLADGTQIFKNIVSVARAMSDLGIFLLSIIAVWVLATYRQLSLRYAIWIMPFLVFSFSFLFLTNPVNHRYFLVVFVLMLLPVLKWLSGKKIIYSVILILLLMAGHFQLYPGRISNGWDCTLAHLPYHGLKKDFLNFLDENKINRHAVGTVFPINTSPQQDKLSGRDTVRMANIHGGDMASFKFILYSNIGNDFSDEQLENLESWQKVKQKRSGCVKMILYEKPN